MKSSALQVPFVLYCVIVEEGQSSVGSYDITDQATPTAQSVAQRAADSSVVDAARSPLHTYEHQHCVSSGEAATNQPPAHTGTELVDVRTVDVTVSFVVCVHEQSPYADCLYYSSHMTSFHLN